jgi:hypothetical protein
LNDSGPIGFDGESVQLSYQQDRDRDQPDLPTPRRQELIRRFLLQVLPKGIMRVRHFGFPANRYRSRHLAQLRMPPAEPPP